MKHPYGIGILATLAILTVLTACQDPAPTPAGEAAPTLGPGEVRTLDDGPVPTPEEGALPTLRPGEVRTLDDGPYCGWERMHNEGHYWEKYLSGTTLSWTPDGNYIIFDNRHKIMRVSTDGTQMEVLINTHPRKFEQESPRAKHQSHASLSRDGKKLAYSTCQFTVVMPYLGHLDLHHAGTVGVKVDEITEVRMHIGELAVADADGSNQIRLTKEGAIPRLPTWSPDGTKITYTSTDEKLSFPSGVPIVMSADGSEPVPWTKLGPMQTEDPSISWDEMYASRMDTFLLEPPSWSPDSSKILVRGEFTGEDHHSVGRGVGEVGHLYKLDLQEESVADLGLSISGPSWSPDGGRIAFTHLKGEEVLISSMAHDGSDRQEIINLGSLEEYVSEKTGRNNVLLPIKWSPDGLHLLFTCPEGLCVTDMAGNIVAKTPESLEPRLWDESVDRQIPLRGAWSPDGQRIAVRGVGFPQREGSPLVYTMKYDGTDVRVLVRGGYTEYPANVDSEDGNATIAACRQGYVVPQPQDNWGLVQDCEILGSIRNQLRGDRSLNWTPGTPLEDWRGVIISGAPPRVTGLKLTSEYSPDYSISGILPPTLAELDQLERVRIDLQREHSEVIPAEWEKLDLEHLDIINFKPLILHKEE